MTHYQHNTLVMEKSGLSNQCPQKLTEVQRKMEFFFYSSEQQGWWETWLYLISDGKAIIFAAQCSYGTKLIVAEHLTCWIVRTAAAAATSYRLQKITWHHRLHTEDAASSIGKAENQKIQDFSRITDAGRNTYLFTIMAFVQGPNAFSNFFTSKLQWGGSNATYLWFYYQETVSPLLSFKPSLFAICSIWSYIIKQWWETGAKSWHHCCLSMCTQM